jgi:hypothetical protein
MCENRTCDYPVNEKETKEILEWCASEIHKILNQKSAVNQEWVNRVYDDIVDRDVTKKLCPSCALNLFVSFLIIKKGDDLDPSVLEWGLGIMGKIAVEQHTQAVIADAEKKMKKTSNSNFGNFPTWFMIRIRRQECKQSRNLTKGERELMRKMRDKGESLRDLAYIFDRSVSTVQQNCQGVEALKNGVYY